MIRKQFSNGNVWLFLAIMIMGMLFVSSSMTYTQQSQIGNLENLLRNRPFEQTLSGVNFGYAGSTVSIDHLDYFKFVEFFLRKAAHFFSYFFLGICWFMGLKNKFKSDYLLFAILSFLAAAGFGGLDEAHQMFTGGRSPLFQDVLLNATGALVGVTLVFIISGIRRVRKK
jgi:VanZ family protein